MLKTLKLLLPMVFAMVFLANCDTSVSAGSGGGTACAVSSLGGYGPNVIVPAHSNNVKGKGYYHATGYSI